MDYLGDDGISVSLDGLLPPGRKGDTVQLTGNPIIAGPWTVLEYTGTHLVMEAYNPNKMVWTLEKMY